MLAAAPDNVVLSSKGSVSQCTACLRRQTGSPHNRLAYCCAASKHAGPTPIGMPPRSEKHGNLLGGSLLYAPQQAVCEFVFFPGTTLMALTVESHLLHPQPTTGSAVWVCRSAHLCSSQWKGCRYRALTASKLSCVQISMHVYLIASFKGGSCLVALQHCQSHPASPSCVKARSQATSGY